MINRNISTPPPEIELTLFNASFHKLTAVTVVIDNVSTEIKTIFFVVKIKIFLCLINEAQGHKDVWGSGGVVAPFLTWALDGGEWSASCPGSFASWEMLPIPIG
jgi:hypothetical protein